MRRFILLSIAAFACDGENNLVPVGPITHPSALEAMEKFPNGLELHENVIHRSCSPTGGVCHNGKEYPDLHTFGNLVAALDKPCNRDKADEPEAVFDGCEPPPDEFAIMGSPEWRSKISWVGPEEYPEDFSTVFRRIMLADPAPRTVDHGESKILRDGNTLVDLKGEIYDRNGNLVPGFLVAQEGQREVVITDLYYLEYRAYLDLQTTRGGDPNGNGRFGSAEPWVLIAPGHPLSARSPGPPRAVRRPASSPEATPRTR
jgi:hypothetical protein